MTVDLVLATRSDALIVPEEALLLRGQKEYLYLVQDNNQIKRVAVQTGQRRPGEIEIVQGVQAGDTIVVNGLQKIREGQQVKPQQAAQGDSSPTAGTQG
jgi:membrane fusion protein (multidrug efflux system)